MTKKIRLIISVLFVCILFALPLSAFDWGGFVSADVGIKGTANADLIKKITQSDRLTLWMRIPFPLKDSYFTAEGFYDFKYANETKEITHLLDISLCKLSMTVNEPEAKFTLNMGRYGISDLSGFVFAQTADGIELRVSTSRFESKFYGGYTGLLNSYTAPMNVSQFSAGQMLYQPAASTVIGSFFMSFPRLFKQQTLSCEISGFGGQTVPALFTTAALNGPIYGSLFYAVSSTAAFEMPRKDSFLFSNLSRFELTAYLPFMSSFLSWNTVFATGKTGSEKTKNIGDFKSLSIIPASLSGSVKYAGNVKTGLTGSFKPHSSLLWTLSTDAFFNVMNASAAKGFIGVQWQTAVRWHIFSDLQLSVSAGQFFTDFDKKKAPYTLATVKLLYSF